VPTWASYLTLHLHLDALTLHLTILTLYLDHLSPLNNNSCLKMIRHMCMLIVLNKWKNEGVYMQLLRYMQDTFLKFDTLLNDESV
jgi:hypothetical protein